MRCSKCGTELPDGARFCYMCASPVEDSEEVTESAEVEDGDDVEESEAGEASDEGVVDGDEAEASEEPEVEEEDAVEDGDESESSSEEEEDAGAAPAEAIVDVVTTEDNEDGESGSIPAVVKLEAPLSVGAVPFVPMAPSPRSAYMSRRIPHPVRAQRPGTNSAPTVASGYSGLGVPQNSADQGADKAAKSDDAAQSGVSSLKSKLNRAFSSWSRGSKAAEQPVETQPQMSAAEQAAAVTAAVVEEEEKKAEEATAAQVEPEVVDTTDVAVEPDVAAEAEPEVEADAAAPAESSEPAASEPGATVLMPAAEVELDEGPELESLPDRNDVSSFWKNDDEDSTDTSTASSHVSADVEQDDEGDLFGEQSTRDLSSLTNQAAGYGSAYESSRTSRASSDKTKLIPIILAVCVAAVLVVGIGMHFASNLEGEPTIVQTDEPEETTEPEEQTEPEEEEVTEQAITVREAVNDYSWSELKQISDLIAAAGSDEEGLEIAKSYNLCTADGKLDGSQSKKIELTDGTVISARIIGFRHDTLAYVSGVAGITFFSDSSITTKALNDGGMTNWSNASLRSWLANDAIELFPDDLVECLVSVKKTTTNATNFSAQEETDDMLWLISYSELTGDPTVGSIRYGSYTNEGAQYQLFSDLGVNWNSTSTAYTVYGDCANWWTRSADTANSGLMIAPRNADGAPGYARNPAINTEVGVVPGFCI